MVIAGVAWAVSGDPVRALAVFVVATPCPLILAAPIALMSGLSRAATAGVVVKGGGTIERLGEARSVLFDKTGTVTLGHPELGEVVPSTGCRPTRCSGSRPRSISSPRIRSRRRSSPAPSSAGWQLALPEHAEEAFGRGIEGVVDGHCVLVGSARWLREHRSTRSSRALGGGAAQRLVGIDGAPAGVLLLGDRLRADAAELVPRPA